MGEWYVAKTKPRREVAASVMLAQRDVEVYVPRTRASRRADPTAERDELLFPGYVFVRMVLNSNQWLRARSAPGIAYFLGDGDGPTALPDDLIDAIREGVDLSEGLVVRSPFKRGEAVVIKHGPFEGMEAIFDGRLTARGRVRVLLEIVQRLVPVDLMINQLAKAG